MKVIISFKDGRTQTVLDVTVIWTVGNILQFATDLKALMTIDIRDINGFVFYVKENNWLPEK